MHAKCKPTPREGKRNLFCIHYDRCLDQAIHKTWETWNCTGCDQQGNQDPEYISVFETSHPVAYYEVMISGSLPEDSIA
jgi:hypothetical protein